MKRGTMEAIQSAERKSEKVRNRLRDAEQAVRWAKVAYLERAGWKHLGIRTGPGHWGPTTIYCFLAPRGTHYSLNEAVKVQVQREKDAARRAAKKAVK